MNYLLTLSPLVRVIIPLCLGIIAEKLLPESRQVFIPLLIIFSCLYFLSKALDKKRIYRGISLFLLWGLGGSIIYCTTNNSTNWNSSQKFSIITIEKIKKNTNSIITFHGKSDLEQESIKVYATLKKDSVLSLNPGDRLIGKFQYYPPKDSKNPNSFDFKEYLSNQGINHQTFISSKNNYKIIHGRPNVFYRLNETAQTVLEKYIPDEKIRGVLESLLLGNKSSLDGEIKTVYSKVGVMHVLAVSGLHVGIIMILLTFVSNGLKKLKRGALLQTAFIILGIWTFAGISGFSPSVCRASLMFSFIILGRISSKKANVFNSIAASAIVLLFFEPNLLFDVGFQLSYSAVLAIIIIQPLIYSRLYFSFSVVDWVWQLMTVSIAATLGTLPFTLYYFGLFPLYFIITNIIVVPLAGVLIGLGLCVLTFSFIPVLALFFGRIVSLIVAWQNEVLTIIANFDYSQISYFIDKVQFGIIILLLILFIEMLKARSIRVMPYFQVLIGIVVLYSALIKPTELKNKLIFHSMKKGVVIQMLDRDTSYVFSSVVIDSIELKYSIFPSVNKANNHFELGILNPSLLNADYHLVKTQLNTEIGYQNFLWTNGYPKREVLDIIIENNCFVLIANDMTIGAREQWRDLLDKRKMDYFDLRINSYSINVDS